MIKKYLTYLISALTLSLSINAFALSFGDIKVHSHFAEQFNAEINIPSYTDDEIDNIAIQLADKSEFAKRGLEYQSILKNFRFKLQKRKNGTLYIHVTSVLVVKELSVSLLVEVTWPSGRIIKQYDILLTPQAVTQLWDEKVKSTQSITNPVIQRPVFPRSQPLAPKQPLKVAKAPVVQRTVVPNTATPKSVSSTSGGKSDDIKKMQDGSLRYNAVKPGDSLSILAQAFRPDSRMSMQQVMVALFEQNRNAFLNDNIDKLQAGVPLTLRNFDRIWDISRKEAIAFIERISGSNNSNAPKNVLAASASTADEQNSVFKNNTARLQIAQVDEDIIPADIMEKIKNDQIRSKTNVLQQTRAEAQRIERQNEALRKRIAELEAKIDRSAENLFLNSSSPANVENKSTSTRKSVVTQQNANQEDNLVVTDSELAMAQSTPANERDYTLFGVIAIILLLIVLFGLRNKEQIIDAIDRIKSRKTNNSNHISVN